MTDKGDAVRLAILAELLRREGCHDPPPSYQELAHIVDRDIGAVAYHLRILSKRRLVHWRRRQPRTLVLTELGRLTAEILRDTAI